MRSQRLFVFVAVVIVAALLHGFLAGPLGNWLGVTTLGYYTAAFILAAALALITPKGEIGGRSAADLDGDSSYLGAGDFLCDSCKYDNSRDCSRPERPNAIRCPDYRSR